MKDLFLEIQEHLGITNEEMEEIVNNISTEDLLDMWNNNKITMFDKCQNCGSIVLNDGYDGWCSGCY